MPWGICCSPVTPSGRIRPVRWSCTSRRHRPDTWALCGRWAGATRRGRAAKRTRPRPSTASGAAPRAETARRRWRWDTATKKGGGCPVDDAQAAHWYEEAARRGLPLGQYDLGCLYEAGTGRSTGSEKGTGAVPSGGTGGPGGPSGGPAAGKRPAEPNGSPAGRW